MPVTISGDSLNPDSLKPQFQARSHERRSRLRRATLTSAIAPALPNDLLPELTIEQIAITDIRLPRRQLRKVGPDDIAEVAASLRRFRVSMPILLGKDNRLIDGVVVVEAAKSLGLTCLPAVRAEHLTEAQERALRIALNRIGQRRDWSVDLLRDELLELEALGEQVKLLGFSDIELDQVLLASVTDLNEAEEETEADESQPAVCQPGDLWQLGDHLLLCGDAKSESDWERLLGGEKARLGMTDPPYAVAVSKVVSTRHRDFVEGGGDMTQAAFEELIRASFSNAMSSLVDGGILYSFMDWKHVADLIVIGKDLGFEHMNVVTWIKSQAGMGSMLRSQTEFVVALKKPGKHVNNVALGKHGRDRSNAWFYPGAGTRGSDAQQMLKDHPTPKPVPMLIDALLDVTGPGDLVVDPFGGSGSTLIACEQARRRARLIELDPHYCDLILTRWSKLTGEDPVLVGGRDAPGVSPRGRNDEAGELCDV